MADEEKAPSLSTDEEFSSVHERDEVDVIERGAAKDTFRVNVGRLATTAVLLVTAFAVTFTTYKLLKNEEKENFESAFEKFSRTVGDAAIGQQDDLRDGMSYMATIFSVHAEENNLTWPFVLLPGFENYGANMLKQAHAEVASLFPMVKKENYDDWVDYANENYQDWVKQGHMIQKGSLERLTDPSNETYNPFISKPTPEGFVKDDEGDVFWPSWYFTPPPASCGYINWNVASIPDAVSIIIALQTLRHETLVSEVREYGVSVPTAMTFEEHDKLHSKLADSSADFPHSMAFRAVHKQAQDYNSEIVAMYATAFSWDEALLGLLPEGVAGIHIVLINNCNQSFTYEIEGGDALFVGEGDLHETQYDDMAVVVNLALHTDERFSDFPGHCQYSMYIYPTSSFEASYDSNTPEIYAAVVACTFVIVALVFFLYDVFVQRRNTNLVVKAAQTNAIVSSMFPEHMRERIIGNTDVTKNKNRNLKTFLNDGKDKNEGKGDTASKPLADLFLETTVLHADICGFTAWSSVREPFQVFTFLEAVYQAFDAIAKKRKIFKVETVGDCYVAVAGLPEPRKDHAVAMARFAREIMIKMYAVTMELEVLLGPGTGELSLRIGMHSGQVTGGVLRGERSRFQLFGDAMNTSSYMESTGMRGKIHVSKETAALLEVAGKGDWVEKRDDRVPNKGKTSDAGNIFATYWVRVHGDQETGSTGSGSDPFGSALVEPPPYELKQDALASGDDARTSRLIDWNTEMLLQLLKQVVAHRRASTKKSMNSKTSLSLNPATTPFEEVQEIIALPEFDKNAAAKVKQQDPTTVEIPKKVVDELHRFVTLIAGTYRNNPFHNFAHASHVVMSIVKLMSRILAPSEMDWKSNKNGGDGDNGIGSNIKNNHHQAMHDHTYGINSDPLTQFACAFSGLIHDVNHSGVPNAQLIKEKDSICSRYNDRSVAEQNSLDLAWEILMKPDFDNLRGILFPTEAELVRFRQLVVNSIMATDIADKDLKALRNGRWDKAFNLSSHGENQRDGVNRKATIVIEHLIQASDVSHTMQHWHVYRQWNQNLFEELYVAYLHGRAEKDPAEFWYKGELGFFDFYIIPLTQKLKDCGVFGVSSGEYLNYARNNREEWEARGEKMVAHMAAETRQKYGEKYGDKKEQPMAQRIDFSGAIKSSNSSVLSEEQFV